jgi:hypothetical protein
VLNGLRAPDHCRHSLAPFRNLRTSASASTGSQIKSYGRRPPVAVSGNAATKCCSELRRAHKVYGVIVKCNRL